MLSYAFQTLKQSTFDNISVEEFDNVQNLFAAILSKGISQQLKQGIYREYRNTQADINTVRGKINMPETIKNRAARRQAINCSFDELTENNLLNDILKTTATLLIKSKEVDDEYKDLLKKEMLYFSNVDGVDAAYVPWNTIRFSRNNQTYRMLISICKFILDGMLLTESSGDYKLASFIDEQHMHRLYEKFILEYYIKEFPQLNVSSSQIPWALDDGVSFLLPVMQSDVMLTYKDRVLIIDAKCYSHTTQTQYGVHTLHSNNLYQIFTYVKNKQSQDSGKTVSGMLLYARTDEEIQPDNTYMMSGNRIDVKTLDLNKDFTLIAKQLNDIVAEFFGIKN